MSTQPAEALRWETAAPRRPASPIGLDRIVQYATALLVLALVVLPLAPTVYQSFRDLPLYDSGGTLTLSAYARLLGSREFLVALGNTLTVAVGATLLAQILGVCCALVVARTDMPARRFVGSLMLWPLYLSQLVLALGWIVAYGPSGLVTLWLGQWLGSPPWNLYSLGGLTIVAGCSLAPLTYMYCVDAARTVDPALEDAMRMSGAGPLRALFAVTVPLIRPALTASLVLNFVLCLELFSLPLLLGVPSGYEFLTTFIYSHGFEASPPDHALVGALAVVLLLIASLLVMVQGKLVGDRRRFVTVSGKAGQRRLAPLGAWRWPLAGFALAYIGLTTVVVIGCLVLRAFTSALSPYVPLQEALTLSNFTVLLDDPATLRAIVNTVTTAVAVGVIGTLLAVGAALVATRSTMPGRRLLEFAALYPRAVPGILIGMGVLWAAAFLPPVAWLQNTIGILVLAFVIRHLPVGYAAIQSMLVQISADHDRAARMCGASWLEAMRSAVAPQLRPALVTSFALLAMHAVKEYAVAVFLFGPGSEILGTTMLTQWIQGEYGPVAALAVVQIVLIVVLLAAFRRFLGTRAHV
ncbi:Iron(III) transport system permease protein [Hyphomicrobiales bacterium]|nr:Iron(III) transport system permease protein [Hyphomicrobiales bacterium]CAH1697548.1 Iron(III) transport system permease protein [Hyphomicrobiales bacterium]CAI0346303.1 iron(III) transport system permease protein [Hyphomicrobiales bacterium]